MVENQQVEDPPSMKFTWRIENFSRLNTKKLYSEVFVVGGYKWRVVIYPKGANSDHFSMYLNAADWATLPYGWSRWDRSRYSKFSLTVVNQVNSKQSVRKGTQLQQFNASSSNWGYTSFMPLSDLNDPSRGYLVNDACVVEAEVSVPPYAIIKVARDEDLAEQIGRDIYFDLVDHDKVPSFRFQNCLPFNLFKEEVAKEFGIPVQFQRFWIWADRENNTYRPDRPLTSQEEAQTVGQIREDVLNETQNAELNLFLEVELGLYQQPIPPPVKTKEDILLFFKLYDPQKGELRYVGRLFVKSYSMPIEIFEEINQMSGFAPDEEIELYEEIYFEPTVYCEHLDKFTSFRLSEIEDGDIICFQKSPPTVPSFLEYVHNGVHRDGIVDRLKKEKMEKEKLEEEKEKLEEEKKKKESEHRLMKEKEDKLQTEADELKRRKEKIKRNEEEERVRKEEEEREQKEAEEQKEKEEENRQVPPQILISDFVDKDIKEAEEIEKELLGMVDVSSFSSLSSSAIGDLYLRLDKIKKLLEIEDPKEVLDGSSRYPFFETVITPFLRKPEILGQTRLNALRCFYYDLHFIQKAYTKSLELRKKHLLLKFVVDHFETQLNSTQLNPLCKGH